MAQDSAVEVGNAGMAASIHVSAKAPMNPRGRSLMAATETTVSGTAAHAASGCDGPPLCGTAIDLTLEVNATAALFVLRRDR